METKDAIEKTVGLYSNVGWKKWFAKIRFWDAPYEKVENLVSKEGVIIDLGCGEGIFSNFLTLSAPTRRVLGIEMDKKRLEQADRGLRNTSFKYGDVTKISIPKSDVIICFHLLHHLVSTNQQELLLIKCKKSLNKNGSIIIIEIDNRPILKYLISWLTDHFVVAWLFGGKLYEPNIYFRNRANWLKLFKKLKLKCRTFTANKNMPFSHIIFECVKTS